MKGMNLFRKNLPAMNLTFAFCFLIAAMALVTREVTGTELNETNISAHVNAQKQALSAISSGVEQLERSCIYSDEQSDLSNQLENFSLEVDADFEKIREIRSEEKIKSQELLRKSTDYNSKSCNLFSTLLDSENSSTACGKARRAKSDSELIASSVIELQQVDEILRNTFLSVIELEAKGCMSSGTSKNLYNKHKNFLEKIGGGTQTNLINRIESYINQISEFE